MIIVHLKKEPIGMARVFTPREASGGVLDIIGDELSPDRFNLVRFSVPDDGGRVNPGIAFNFNHFN